MDGEERAGQAPEVPLRWRAAHVLALTALAVAQPVLGVLGDNPTFFVAHGADRTTVVVVALVVTFALPAALIALEALVDLVRPSWGWTLHVVVVGALAGLVAATVVDDALAVVLDDLSQVSAPVTVLLAVTAGWGFTRLYRRRPLVRSVLSYLAAAPVLFLGAFAFASPANDLLFPEEVAAATVEIPDDAPPIVVVVFDELPLASVLDRSAEAIDPRRFPNLARLAGDGTWYADATTVAGYTHEAVPALLSGRTVRDDNLPPSTSGHPDTLFTLLADGYRISAHEQLTDLCTPALCDSSTGATADPSVDVLVEDLAVVAGHVTLPALLDDWLPEVDDQWAGFGDDSIDLDQEAERIAEERAEFVDTLGEQDRVGDFRRAIAAVEARDEPALWFLHTVFPHVPWSTLPDGTRYPDIGNPGLDEDAGWTTEASADRALQRHLLQAQYADHLLGELLDRLEAEDVYDEALVVVTADHGASFATGTHRRLPDEATLAGIMPVPLVVKWPGATAGVGERDDRPAQTVDVVPTIADVLGVEVPWDVDGVSLLGEPREPFARDVHARGEALTAPPGPLDVAGIVDRIWARLGEGRRLQLYGLGAGADLIGRPVDDVVVGGDPGACWQPADEVPGTAGWVGGHLETDHDGDIDLAVVAGGRVAGTAPTFADGDEAHRVFVLGEPDGWDAPSLWRVVGAGLVRIPGC